MLLLLLLLQHSLFFAFLCTPKNRQIGVFTLFDILEAKSTVNTDVFPHLPGEGC